MNKKVIAIDLDDTVFDNFSIELLKRYNKKYNDNVKREDIKNYNVQSYLKKECKNIFEEFMDGDFVNSRVIPLETILALQILNEKYDIYFVTAGYPTIMKERNEVLKKYLSFYRPKKLVMLNNKSLFDCDIMIDDCVKNLENTNAQKTFCINRAWNNEYNDGKCTKVDNFCDVLKFL